MSLVGNLEDLGLGDILQIVSLSRKSGILYLRAEPDADGRRAEGEIIFQNGQVIRAISTEASQNLGELLLARGIITEQQLDEALGLQRAGGGRDRLGQVLIKHLGIPPDKIQEAIRKQTEAVVYAFFQWARGDFSFELKEADGALDKVDIELRHMVLDAGLNPQFLAMEGTRLKDEARTGRPLDPASLPVKAGAAAPTVEAAGQNGHAPAAAGAPQSPAPHEPEEGQAQSDPFADLSLDASELAEAPRVVSPSALPAAPSSSPARELPGTRPGSAPPAPPQPPSAPPAAPSSLPARELPGAGAVASPALPAAPSPLPARELPGAPPSSSPARPSQDAPHSSARPRRFTGPTVNLSEELGLSPGQAALGGQSSRGLGMLKAMISELTSPEAHGQITLLILRFASELMRRAVLFLVKEDEVVGLGQFGIELPDGENPDRVVRGIKVPLGDPSIFVEVLRRRAAVKAPLGDGRWDAYLVDKLGGHRPAEVFCAPISSGSTIAAVLYADNAPEATPIGDTEALEIFLHQAGLQMEKALLERKIREMNRPGR